MKLQNNKGFTLIELLVVITIIAILATGATATYTSQIQKARDSTRLTDINALRSGVEQFYQDKSEYPSTDISNVNGNYLTGIIMYVPKLPKDPKSGQLCNKGTLTTTACDYMYAVSKDTNGILRGEYKISTGFENSGNVEQKAALDGGRSLEENRLEIGLNLNDDNKSTVCNRSGTMNVDAGVSIITTNGNCVTNITNTGDGHGTLMIAGN